LEDKFGRLTPVKTIRKSAIVTEKIKSLILDNQYRQGEKLPSESELARLLSVSRASVREAFRALELMGLIEVRSGSGTYVKNKDLFNLSKFSNPNLATVFESEASTMLEIVEARKMLETNIIELAVENTLPEDLKGIEEILAEMETSLDNEEGFRNADLKFHSEIARLTKNRVIEAMVNSIYGIVRENLPRAYYFVCSNPKLAKRLMSLHRQVLQSLQTQDKKRAKACMASHTKIAYEISKDYLKDLMKAEGIIVEQNERESRAKGRKEGAH
jgi:GntR family transcriptional regulator, transcriptional repressor for pyruvate dehydrogenase complex